MVLAVDIDYSAVLIHDILKGKKVRRSIQALNIDTIYTYANVLTWPEQERWEILQGVPYVMSPAPTVRHQEVVLALSRIFGNYLQRKA